jgi:lambda family phage tail tape measure protein
MLDGVLMGTQSISDGFRDMARVIIAQLLKIAAYRAIAGIFGNDAFGGMFAPTPNAKGNIFSNGNVVPFAKGGVVNRPTLFPMANGTGLMGEAGPEAVMPLRRDSRGRLGVAGGGTSVTVNNMAPGVQVQTRQTDQGLTLDLVMRSIANAVQEGGNDVADSLERSYGLGRGRVVY